MTKRDTPLPPLTSQHRAPGDYMLTVDHALPELIAELQARLDDGALVGIGPVTLASGPFLDAELAGRVLLADLDHLGTLAEHTARRATAHRWLLGTSGLHRPHRRRRGGRAERAA